MKKGIIVSILALAFALPGFAQEEVKPILWKHHNPVKAVARALFSKKTAVAFVLAAPLAASLVATQEAHECRVRNGVAPCSGGYGPFAAREGLRFGLSLGFGALSAYGHHEGYKEWFIMAGGMAAWNGVDAYRQANKSCPRGYHFLPGTKFTCTDSDEGYGKR